MQHKSAKAAQVSESGTSQLNAAQVGKGSIGKLKQLNGGSMKHKSAKAAQVSSTPAQCSTSWQEQHRLT
jgi:hypothetical protein